MDNDPWANHASYEPEPPEDKIFPSALTIGLLAAIGIVVLLGLYLFA